MFTLSSLVDSFRAIWAGVFLLRFLRLPLCPRQGQYLAEDRQTKLTILKVHWVLCSNLKAYRLVVEGRDSHGFARGHIINSATDVTVGEWTWGPSLVDPDLIEIKCLYLNGECRVLTCRPLPA